MSRPLPLLPGLLVLALPLAGCGGGPSDETLVDTLQVVAVVAEPPEIAPGEATVVTPVVADPQATGADVLQWTCTPSESGCAEAFVPGFGVTVGTVAAPPTTTWAAPTELAYVFAEDPSLVFPVLVWTLACAPGACSVVDEVAADPQPGTAEGDALVETLADPSAILADLPIEAVALTLQTFGVSARSAEERVVNPVLLATPDPAITGAAGEEVVLAFDLDAFEGVSVWGYTTASGFTSPAVEPDETGRAELTLVMPDAGVTADVWVVVVNEGGSAVWTATATGS